MSLDSSDASREYLAHAAPLLARAAAAEQRAAGRLATAIDDFFLAEEGRLDDRSRAAIAGALTVTLEAIAREVAGHAARQLADQPQGASFAPDVSATLARLWGNDVVRDRELFDELLGQVRLDLLGDALLANRAPGTQPTLMPRLAEHDDGVIAAAARAYLLAENRRRSIGAARHVDLPAPLHRRLVWWVAAALRDDGNADASGQVAVDRALVTAARRSLAAHDDQDSLEAAAIRLAGAIDPRHRDLAELLVETLEDGRAALFVAVVARAAAITFADARTLVLDPAGDQLWLAMRAQGLDRVAIARVGLALADADPRRDIDAFADMLDMIAAIPADAARDALAPLALPADFRAAIRALAGYAGR